MARRIRPSVDGVTGLRGEILANVLADIERLEHAESDTYDFTAECDRLRRLAADLRGRRVVELRRWGDGVKGEAARTWPRGTALCRLHGNTLTPVDYQRLGLAAD